MRRFLLPFFLFLFALPLTASAQIVYSRAWIVDFYGQSTPSNPPTNFGRVYFDTTTQTMKCRTSAGADCWGGGGGAPTGAAGGDLGGTYPNPTVVSVAHVTTGVLPAANGGAVPIFSTAATGVSMVTSGVNTVLVGPVSMVTPAADGTYRFVLQVIQTTPGSGGTCNAGSLLTEISYKDADTAVTYAFTGQMIGYFSLSSGATLTSSLQMTSAGNGAVNDWTSVAREFRAAAGTAIQYQILQSPNSNCTTPPVFTARPALYYMGY